jgi:PAS domain S-box-containing protein
LTDITEKSLAEEALRASENRYRVLFNSGNDAVFVHQPRSDGTLGKFIEVNRVACQRYGYTRVELLNLTPSDLSYPGKGHEMAARIKKLFAEKHILFETIQVAKDGTKIPAEIHSHLFDFHGKPTVLSIARDMTARRRASEYIHTLSRQLMKAQESERQMIARELHDRVAQDLSTLKIGIDTLLDNQPDMSEEVNQRASNLAGTLQGTIAAVRDLAYDLRPPGLDQFGLVQTISQYCEDFTGNTDTLVDFHSAGMDRLNLDFDTKINLYRLIQEGLNNVRKHADARLVTARLIASSPNIILRIEDDGKGFDVRERMTTMDNEKRMGLRSMEERVGLLGGKMRIRSRPSQGTRIFIEIPYKEIKRGSKEKHPDY